MEMVHEMGVVVGSFITGMDNGRGVANLQIVEAREDHVVYTYVSPYPGGAVNVRVRHLLSCGGHGFSYSHNFLK
jgi:hypothetical protein